MHCGHLLPPPSTARHLYLIPTLAHSTCCICTLEQDSCSDGFKAWLGSIQTCDPSTNPSTCCAPLLSLGTECIGSVFAAAEQTDQQTVQAL